jgi:hypothetical protein
MQHKHKQAFVFALGALDSGRFGSLIHKNNYRWIWPRGGGEGRGVIGKKIYYSKTVERNPFLIFIKFPEFIAERGQGLSISLNTTSFLNISSITTLILSQDAIRR